MKGSQLSLHQKLSQTIKLKYIDPVLKPLKRGICAIKSGVAAVAEYWTTSSSQNTFIPLTPAISADSRTLRYEHELLAALKDPQVRNIAITGDYGAGKSSFIKTFEHRNPQHSYAYVSLATFDLSNCTDDNEALDDKTADRIEETIVQQLLYSVSARKLPKSRLKRIYDLSPLKAIRNFFILAIATIAILRLYNAKNLPLSATDSTWLNEQLVHIPNWVAFPALILSCLYFLYHLIKAISNLNADGWTIKGGLPESVHHSSVLHKHIDELMYCFERSNIDIVFIEDLDRFEDQNIFFRLREINFIINRSPQVIRPIFFVYAIRDELFSSKQRTKFFDLIIPIIPIINSENSREKFIQLLHERRAGESNLADCVDLGLLEAVSYYVDDMRLVINIVNEFDMYAASLMGTVDLSMSKLFSAIVIKNLYPAEYTALIKKEGYIYKAFELYEGWKRDIESNLQQQSDAIVKDLQQRKELIAGSIQELRVLLWHKAFELCNTQGQPPLFLRINNSGDLTATQFSADGTFQPIHNPNADIRAVTYNGHYNHPQVSQSIKSKALLASIDPPYEEQERLIQSWTTPLEERLSEILSMQTQCRTLPFREAIKTIELNDQITAHFADKKMGIINYLLKSGFLDTDYNDYIGYFYPGSLTYDDKNLIIALREGLSPAVGVLIHNPKKVLEKLSPNDLKNGQGLLHELIVVLTLHKPALPYQPSEYLESIFSNAEQHIERLQNLLEHSFGSSHTGLTIKEIFNYSPACFLKLLAEGKFSSTELKQKLLIEIIRTLSADNLKQLSGNNKTTIRSIIEELENVSLFVETLDSHFPGVIWLKKPPVKFRNLKEASKDTLSKLIREKHIELNLHTIRLIARTFQDNPNSTVSPVSYSYLSSLSIDGLDELILFSPTDFVDELLKQITNLNETEESFCKLLTFGSESPETIEDLLSHTSAIVPSLGKIPEEVWSAVIESARVQPSWATLLTYYTYRKEEHTGEYQEDPIGNELRAYLSSPNIASGIVNAIFNIDDFPSDLAFSLSSDEDIDESTFKILANDLPLDDDILHRLNVSERRWETILATDHLVYSQATHAHILSKVPNLLGDYLCSTWSGAEEHIDYHQLNTKSLITISKSPKVPLAAKAIMWSKQPESSYIDNALLSVEAAKILTDSGINIPVVDANTIRAILTTLPHDETRKKLLTVLVKKKLYIWPIVKSLIECLSEPGYLDLASAKRHFTVASTDVNRDLVYALQDASYVSSITEQKGALKAFVKTSNLKAL
ncbi:hypothetical protein E8E95_14910 [Pseudomonas sp. BN414]|uniref:YobI family P-loop NTPase n=1 Tax=Pseudomonas sp. BN414 TaxID=2567888 RepID=UPI0024546496|nr:hypothetical protein [Pseudomonas sp. BN414]MDH4567971.1 hypothetical protein [Pseudomonas sp. BN414]